MDRCLSGQEKAALLSSLDKEILLCSKCRLREDTGVYGPTPPEGYSDVEIMVVARNPGSDEMPAGRPLVGRAGKRFDQHLSQIGITRRDCWITNVCKCYSMNNRAPKIDEIECCMPYLRKEIEIIRPKLILVFGMEAMSLLTPYFSGITKHCGDIIENYKCKLGSFSGKAVICVHPSAALRDPANDKLMTRAAQKTKDLLEAFK